MKYSSKRRKTFPRIFLLLIILSLVIVFYQNRDIESGESNCVENIVSYITLPLQKIINTAKNKLSVILSTFKKNKDVVEENNNLKNHILLLQREKETLKGYIEENKRLRDMLDFKNSLLMETVAAQVIGREPNSWFQSITIDKGAVDGIKKDMIVVDNNGLIGRVMVVSPQSSKVMLLLDNESAVPAIIRETRNSGIIYGSGQKCEMKYIIPDKNIKTGYTVETSGLGKIYPKGITIGYITNLYRSNDKLFQTAEITLSAKFKSLEHVLILKENPVETIPGEGN
ncbi:MAG: rod shape-determining protein MreC [Candidatus Eremiobacterota bacterium]